MSVRGSVSFKKKDGSLSVSDDRKYLFWTPAAPPGSSPALTIPIADITNLQQTGASSAKVALKVFVSGDSYVFSFTHKQNAKTEQEAVTDTLSNTISANKVAATAGPAIPSKAVNPAQDGEGGQSAAMAMAKAVSSKAADDSWYDDSKLKADFALQRSLLLANKTLRERFEQALHDKPESVSATQFTAQFWSTRLHLLRAHAIEQAQKQGEYNVLPEIRFTRRPAEKEGEPDIKQLHITKEQIKLIFKQYPIVSEAYNENCPPLDPGQFWQRFFSSRLLKKLKGEKISQQDPPDAVLDRYLDRREGGPASIAHVPHFIDLEGNEQHLSQRKGNRPDETMRPSSFDKVPILRVLNSLSEKMLSHVAPEDGEAHAPIGVDEETFEQLRLRDLAMDQTDNRVVLNIREQNRIVAGQPDQNASAEAAIYAKQDPDKVLASLRSDMQPSNLGGDENGTLRLDRAVGFYPDEDSDDEDETAAQSANGASSQAAMRIGSKAAMAAATADMFLTISQRRVAASEDPKSLNGLSQSTFDALATTHNTTTEFLHYFWTLFLSGDGSRTNELAQLVSTLDRSLDRIEAVGANAEKERDQQVERIKKQSQEYHQRTGKKRRYDLDGLGGGRKAVEAMIRPTVGALQQAGRAYRKALEEQTAERGLVPG